MRLLVVAATEGEIRSVAGIGASTRPKSRITSHLHRNHHLDVLVSGVGMVATAAWCSDALARTRYDLALNFGVCGSFDPALKPPAAVHVVSDRLAEMGAEDDERFITIQKLKLVDENEFPFEHGRLVNANPPQALVGSLLSVDGITVNTVHGNEATIAAIVERFKPQVESMEGAAFMYACLVHDVPFAQIRVVSNFVERRNRAGWKFAEAIDLLGETGSSILDRV